MLVYSGSEQYWKKWCQYLNTLFLKIQPHLLRTMTFLKKDWEQNVLFFFSLSFITEIRLKIMFCVHQYICHTICTQSPKSEESIKAIELLQDSWIAKRNKIGVHIVEKLHCEPKRHLCFFCLSVGESAQGWLWNSFRRCISVTKGKGKDCWDGLQDNEGPKKKN